MAQPTGVRLARLGFVSVLGFAGVLGASRLTGLGQSTAASQPYVLASGNRTIEFAVDSDTSGPTTPLPPPSNNTLIRLEPKTDHRTPDQQAVAQLSEARPRVHAITQFDGGGLAGSNCTMASGAMLLALSAGYVTTGSNLRAFQSDQTGGTDLLDLQTAVHHFGVKFNRRSLTPHDLKQILYAGAGAVIQGSYWVLGDWRLDKGFRGGHAIYLDGYEPAENGHPDRYYVIDPIGTGWSAYKGRWIPADIVDAFATGFSGRGVIYAAWAFPADLAPLTYPEIPAEVPGGAPGGAPRPHRLTTKPLPVDDEREQGGQSGEEQPHNPAGPTGPPTAGTTTNQVDAGTDQCIKARPWFCPFGIVALLPGGATPVPIPSIRLDRITLLYSIPVGPGVVQVIFSIPSGSTPELSYWKTDAAIGGQLQQAEEVQSATINGQPVGVATFQVDTGQYQFVAGATGTDVQAVSDIGTVSSPR